MLKERLLQFFLNSKFIILLFVVSLSLRVILLNIFPIGIVHDELNYVMNAKSLFETGKNIPLTASSLFSWGEKNWDVDIAELPSYIISPWVGPNNLNQFNARLPYVVASSFSVVFLYLIAKQILGKKIAIFAGLVMAFNPWSIHFGRNAFEVSFVSFFYLAGTYLILKNRSWKIFWAYPFFLAGFLSYLGAKLHFLPFIIILLAYKFFTTRAVKERKAYVAFGLLAFLTLLSYTLTLKFQPAGDRREELIFFSNDWASSQVNDERRQAIPSPLANIFSNKATVTVKRVADYYISGFGSTPLFSKGDVVSVYSLWQHGQFYYIDLPLIILGLVVLFSLKRSAFWMTVALVALGPTVSSVDLVSQTYPVRAFPMFPFLCLFSGIGLWFIKDKLRFGRIIFWPVVFIYLVLIANFLYLYFYRYPVYSAERWFLSERIIARYVSLLESNPSVKKIYISTIENPKIVFEEYLFFSGKYNSKVDVVKENLNLENKVFGDGKIVFIHNCPIFVDYKNGEMLIADRRLGCLKEERGERGILDLVDAGTVFIIKNDGLCQNEILSRYYVAKNFSQFQIEKMGKSEFCKNWIAEF